MLWALWVDLELLALGFDLGWAAFRAFRLRVLWFRVSDVFDFRV